MCGQIESYEAGEQMKTFVLLEHAIRSKSRRI
jgi:hypothetical protein